MKKIVKDKGLPIPCEQCILDGKQKGKLNDLPQV